MAAGFIPQNPSTSENWSDDTVNYRIVPPSARIYHPIPLSLSRCPATRYIGPIVSSPSPRSYHPEPPMNPFMPDHSNNEARRDKDACNLQFENFPVGPSIWRKQQDPLGSTLGKRRPLERLKWEGKIEYADVHV